MISQVAVFEYIRHVFRKRFLIGLLSLPVFVGVMALVVMLLVRAEINLKPVGYIDESGILEEPVSFPGQDFQNSLVKIIAFDDEELAQEALQADQIQAYYVIDAKYPETRQAKLVANEEPSNMATRQFGQFVRANLIADFPPDVIQRLTSGNQLVIHSVDGDRQFVQGDWLGMLLPFLVGFIFLAAVFATSGYLLQAVVEEKENRTMELLVSSISPRQLMTGKVLGIIAVGWTQLIVWFGLALILLMVASLFIDVSSFLSISISYLATAIGLFVPAFVMLAALMVAVGATLTDVQEAQQVTSLFTLPLFIPFWFVFQIINHPNGPIAVVLSLFPFTAPIALAIRAGFASIPTWQYVLSLGLLFISALISVWLAGRAFRLGMVRYGQRVAWRDFLGLGRGAKRSK